MSRGRPNSANRCVQPGTLDAAISVLLLLFLDTNAAARSTERITYTRRYYTIDNSGRPWQRAPRRRAASRALAGSRSAPGELARALWPARPVGAYLQKIGCASPPLRSVGHDLAQEGRHGIGVDDILD